MNNYNVEKDYIDTILEREAALVDKARLLYALKDALKNVTTDKDDLVEAINKNIEEAEIIIGRDINHKVLLPVLGEEKASNLTPKESIELIIKMINPLR